MDQSHNDETRTAHSSSSIFLNLPADAIDATHSDFMKQIGDLSNSPAARTAKHTKKVADGTEALLQLTKASLALSAQARQDSARAERFSRRMTWISVAI